MLVEAIAIEYLMELVFMLESSIDVQFQAWLAITFAVIVASYSSRDTLRLSLRIIVVVAYLIAVLALFARAFTEVNRINLILIELASRGMDLEPILYSPIVRLLAFVLGSLIAIVSIFYFSPPKTTTLEKNQTKD